jgi:hypothetical protein
MSVFERTEGVFHFNVRTFIDPVAKLIKSLVEVEARETYVRCFIVSGDSACDIVGNRVALSGENSIEGESVHGY